MVHVARRHASCRCSSPTAKGLKRDGAQPAAAHRLRRLRRSACCRPGRRRRFPFLEARRHLRGGHPARRRRVRRGLAPGRHARPASRTCSTTSSRRPSGWSRARSPAPTRLAISGRSNGGLLVGAALTQRPELFRAVVCGVPLLDMLRYHRFRIAALWIPEYGSPDDPDAFRWLRGLLALPPRARRRGLPRRAVCTRPRPTRASTPMHARKMAARLQAATRARRRAPVLLRLESHAGHGAGKPLGKVIAQLVDEWSFVFSRAENRPATDEDDMKKTRVIILFGGRSAEHEISLLSARNVLAALDRTRFEPVLIGIDKAGRWHRESERTLAGGGGRSARGSCSTPARPPSAWRRRWCRGGRRDRAGAVGSDDVVFPVLHGTFGEDGTVQGLLELAGHRLRRRRRARLRDRHGQGRRQAPAARRRDPGRRLRGRHGGRVPRAIRRPRCARCPISAIRCS